MRIRQLVITPVREDHIARHGVTADEVEEAVAGSRHISRTRLGRFRVIGRTDAGRYLTVIIGPRRQAGVFGLVTARDATLAERRLAQRG